MAYRVEFSAAAARAFRKLTPDVQRRIAKEIDALAENPRHPGVRALAGRQNEYRARAGAYRVLYEIHDQVLVVLVVAIGHQRDVYR